MDTSQLIKELFGTKYLKKKPLFKSNPLEKLTKKYYEFYEEFNLDKTKLLQDLLKIENPKTMSQLEAYDDLVRNLKRPTSEDDYKKLQDNFLILADRYEDLELSKGQIDNGMVSALIARTMGSLNPEEREMTPSKPTAEDLSVSAPDEEVVSSTPATQEQKPPPPPKPSPLPKPSLRGSGAGAGAGAGRATPRVKVVSVTPRKTPRQVEPIQLPPDEQPPADPMPSAMPIDDKPLSVPIPAEVDTEPPMREPMMEEPEPAMPQTPAGQPLEDVGVGTQTDPIIQPNMSEIATQTEPNVNQEISRKVTSVADEQQPGKLDMIPKERLSAENKTEAELLDDINYFYKTFPNELKNISFDRNNKNIEYLKSKHKEIVAKLTAGKKKEEKIGIIISGSEYIKEKLKEIILENSITGLSAKDLIINVEKSEEKQSSDVNSYEFKMGADGKAMAKKEPIYKYIPEVVQQPIKTKPNRIPNTQTKFRSLVTTARKEVANNPFNKPQPKIRLKYSY